MKFFSKILIGCLVFLSGVVLSAPTIENKITTAIINLLNGGTSTSDAQITVTGGTSSPNRGVLNFNAALMLFNTYDGSPQFGIGSTPVSTEFWCEEGGITGSGATFYAQNNGCIGSGTGNVSGNFTAQNLGNFNFGNGDGQLFGIVDPGAGSASTDYITMAPQTLTTPNKIGTHTGAGDIVFAVPVGVPAMTLATMKALTGVHTGDEVLVTDVGINGGSVWLYNGTKWSPVGGEVIFARQSGSPTAPVASFTGAVSGQFTVPGGNPTFPANLLSIGSLVRVDVIFIKSGTAGGWATAVSMGTTGTSDCSIMAISTSTATNINQWVFSEAQVVSNSVYMRTNYATPNSLASSGAVGLGTCTFDFNPASPEIIAFSVNSANASDTFQLISFTITVFP